MKLDLKFIAVIFVLLVALPITLAQDDDTEAYDVIQKAIDALDDGYAYSSEITVTQTFIGEEDGFGSVTSQLADGRIDADGNYHVTLAFQAGEASEALEDMPTFNMELLSLDDTQYANFMNIEDAYPMVFENLESGWYSVDDLMASFDDDSPEQLVIQNLTYINLPADVPLTEDMVLSVEEKDPITIDGVDMRVFEVEVDALQVFIEQNSGIGSLREQLEMILESGDFLAQSKFMLTYNLWIGAEDGILYGGESTGYTRLAYLSAAQMNIPYDIVTDLTTAFAITDHGAVEAITLPEELD